MAIEDGQDALANDLVNVSTQKFLMARMPIIVGDVIAHANDVLKTFTETSYTKKKETKLTESLLGASIRVKFSLRMSQGGNVYGKVYRNGVAIGAEKYTDSPYVQEFTDDLDCSSWQTNDLVQVYCHATGVSGIGEISNFRLCIGLSISATAQDP